MTDMDRIRHLMKEVSERLPEAASLVAVTIVADAADPDKGLYHVAICDAFVNQLPRPLLLGLAAQQILKIAVGSDVPQVDEPRRRVQ